MVKVKKVWIPNRVSKPTRVLDLIKSRWMKSPRKRREWAFLGLVSLWEDSIWDNKGQTQTRMRHAFFYYYYFYNIGQMKAQIPSLSLSLSLSLIEIHKIWWVQTVSNHKLFFFFYSKKKKKLTISFYFICCRHIHIIKKVCGVCTKRRVW